MHVRPSPPRPKDADPGAMPVVAAVVLGLAGVVTAGLAGRALWLDTPGAGERAAMGVLTIFGGAALIAARGLLDARPWAAITGAILAPILTLGTTAWGLYAVYEGALDVPLAAAPPITSVAALLCPFAIAPAIRSSRARAAFRRGSLLGAIDR